VIKSGEEIEYSNLVVVAGGPGEYPPATGGEIFENVRAFSDV